MLEGKELFRNTADKTGHFTESISECILWCHLSCQVLVRIMGRMDMI